MYLEIVKESYKKRQKKILKRVLYLGTGAVQLYNQNKDI